MRALLLAITLTGAASAAEAATCDPGRAVFTRADGSTTSFQVEIADDPSERAQGLMNRRSLADDAGMLFIYESPQQASFWMRNTLIPLDMLFIDPRGKVARVHPMARPLDETPIPGAAPGDPAPERLMVLEIAGGQAAKQDLKEGAVLSHPRLPQATALAPCD
ncbi:DUF192 domain-containing protein [Paracoccus pacificus]|uniref:DUF192 domain-containing protein n=1 Tax=Paracoccus pacificus TaxID=1463598 RepID=A0ABW4R2F6_9RHOB